MKCPCGTLAVHICGECDRAVCEWHSVGKFQWAHGEVKLQPACNPDCKAKYWAKYQQPTKEGK
jgi:hypothetical protein